MLRSLFSGISGLNNHLTMLDVVGSNIANVNTIGYKSSRVTFRELLTQTIRGATRPVSGTFGGTNPTQIGLGATLQSIDPTFTQGNLQTTGKITDLAIEGDSFFIVSDGQNRFYTRAGTFAFDGLGQMVMSGTGHVVQGIMAEDNGTIDYGKPLENIVLGDNLVTPAQATTELKISGNLDANADARGTILQSNPFFALARSDDLVVNLYSDRGATLGVQPFDTLDVSFDAGGTSYSTSIQITATTTIADLIAQLDAIAPAEADFSFNAATGTISVMATGGGISNLQFSIPGRPDFNTELGLNGTIPPLSSDTSNTLLGPARSTDTLDTLYNHSGATLSFNAGDQFVITGTTAGSSNQVTLTVTPGVTTLQDVADAFQQVFGITNASASVVDPQGHIIVTGDPGLNNSLTLVGVANSATTSPNTDFTTNLDFVETQKASDAESWRTTATVYDSLGRDFRIGLTFTKRTGTNLWDWVADAPAGVNILQGGSGTVGFDPNGLLTSFDYGDGSGALMLDPGGGAAVMSINLDPGAFGTLEGLLQFDGASTATAKDFDGHGAGVLQSVTINNAGEIVGQFTNGINRTLAQIALADFNNPNGLQRIGNNLYGVSSNTGPESVTFVGQNATSTIAPGSLEMSNVDLSQEFTQMIIAQRGFQANARVISTGDEMLSELVTLRR